MPQVKLGIHGQLAKRMSPKVFHSLFEVMEFVLSQGRVELPMQLKGGPYDGMTINVPVTQANYEAVDLEWIILDGHQYMWAAENRDGDSLPFLFFRYIRLRI